MRKFIILFLFTWLFLDSIPAGLFFSEDPLVQYKLIQKFIDLVKVNNSHCERAYIHFSFDNEKANMINVSANCYKWGL